MKNLIKKIKNKLKKIRLTYSVVVVTLIGVIILISIIYYITIRPLTSTNENNITISSNNVVDGSGKLLATYKLQDSNSTGSIKKIITIYVSNINGISGADMKRITNNILSKESLSIDQAYINFKQYETDGNRDEVPSENIFDPTDPTTYSNVPENYNGGEEIVNVDFRKYVDLVHPSTDYFEIYKKDDNNYFVFLKQGYTEEDFKTKFLNQFINLDGINFEFQTSADI